MTFHVAQINGTIFCEVNGTIFGYHLSDQTFGKCGAIAETTRPTEKGLTT